MKMYVFIWTICLFAVTHQSDGNIEGFPIESLSPRLFAAEKTTSCNGIFGPTCGDCNTLWTCLGGPNPYKSQNCETSYPGQPYCVDGACSSSPDPDDKQCSTKGFICTGSGYFPNPLNCSQYYFCEGPQGASMAYGCPTGFTYNSQARQCKRRILPSDCSTINCASNPDRFVGYPADPTFYALCLVTDSVITPIMFKCLEPEQFVSAERRCAFRCKNEGREVDVRDCNKYYECFRVGLSFITVPQKCLDGFKFDVEENGCVKGNCDIEEPGSGGGA